MATIKKLDIDYSGIEQQKSEQKSTWRPPVHKFFGKRNPEDGTMEEEPIYVHQTYPAMMYCERDGKMTALIARDEEQMKDLVDDGFMDSPAKFGYLTAPSFEQIQEKNTPIPETAAAKKPRPEKTEL